jgi:hypothetical protein
MSPDLQTVLDQLPADFFGTVEIAYQNGHPGVVKVTQTHKLTTPTTSREHRGNSHVQHRDFNKQSG